MKLLGEKKNAFSVFAYFAKTENAVYLLQEMHNQRNFKGIHLIIIT